jgi:hypothetical protein
VRVRSGMSAELAQLANDRLISVVMYGTKNHGDPDRHLTRADLSDGLVALFAGWRFFAIFASEISSADPAKDLHLKSPDFWGL